MPSQTDWVFNHVHATALGAREHLASWERLCLPCTNNNRTDAPLGDGHHLPAPSLLQQGNFRLRGALNPFGPSRAATRAPLSARPAPRLDVGSGRSGPVRSALAAPEAWEPASSGEPPRRTWPAAPALGASPSRAGPAGARLCSGDADDRAVLLPRAHAWL